MSIDLSSCPYFEVEKGSRVELFINGELRLFGNPRGNCRVYVLFEPDAPSDDVIDDDLSF